MRGHGQDAETKDHTKAEDMKAVLCVWMMDDAWKNTVCHERERDLKKMWGKLESSDALSFKTWIIKPRDDDVIIIVKV